MNQIVSLSGGKDSTAMLHMMLERGEKIAAVVFFDTGWEFPAMHQHIDRVERNIGQKTWRLQSRYPFDYWLTARPIIRKNGERKGIINRIGNGWPSPLRRWCTRQKVETIDSFCKPYPNVVQCIGYAADENRALSKPNYLCRFPLQEWGVTEKDALEYCYSKGYDWGGLYDIFPRVSCYCCPLQPLGELRKLRRHFQELWARMLYLEDQMCPDIHKGFKDYTSVHDLENRFAEEDRQISMFDGGHVSIITGREHGKQ